MRDFDLMSFKNDAFDSDYMLGEDSDGVSDDSDTEEEEIEGDTETAGDGDEWEEEGVASEEQI